MVPSGFSAIASSNGCVYITNMKNLLEELQLRKDAESLDIDVNMTILLGQPVKHVCCVSPHCMFVALEEKMLLYLMQ